ncbi:hypothetical protein LMG29739_00294 [Paraburkholderia solisilvae]|uniref:Uncharacterized protein n=1 Tax=Paraburkholderia solisilvae TaxID=624376 RepID=A0A6J5CZI5_9BURK|nr:hypothetical protein LMG29739_00294 [Paraburkholderia solisilvae]
MWRLGERCAVDNDIVGERSLPLTNKCVHKLISAPLHRVAADAHHLAREITSQHIRQYRPESRGADIQTVWAWLRPTALQKDESI